MSAFLDYLIAANAVVPPTAFFAGVLTEDAGPPDENDSPWFLFYRDTETDDLYFNPTRTVGEWQLVGFSPVTLEGSLTIQDFWDEHIWDWGIGDTQSDFNLVGVTGLSYNTSDNRGPYNLWYTTTLETVSFPLWDCFDSELNVGSNTGLISFSAPLVEMVKARLLFSDNNSLTVIDMPLLETVESGFQISGNGALASISFPSLIAGNGNGQSFLVLDNAALENVSLPVWIPTPLADVDFSENALSVISVDHILARCVASAGYVSGNVNLSGGTNAVPSAAGLTSKATLEGRDPGVTVTVNEEE